MGHFDFETATEASKIENPADVYVVPQPPPSQDANAIPIWPLIIDESKREYGICRKFGNEEADRRHTSLGLLIGDMKQRHEFGVAKYGVPLVAQNHRDHLVDALQEALDGVVYLRAEIEKRGGFTHEPSKRNVLVSLTRIYMKQLEIAIELRGLIYERDSK